jgi:hypothetical protein
LYVTSTVAPRITSLSIWSSRAARRGEVDKEEFEILNS